MASLPFLSMMLGTEMRCTCGRGTAFEKEGLRTTMGTTLNTKLKSTLFLRGFLFAKPCMAVRENVDPFHRKRLSFPGYLAEIQGSRRPKENCLANTGAVAQLL